MFVELLGESPVIKVLDFLLVARDFDYSKSEIAENAEISWNTLASIWPFLFGNEIIIKTRRVGKQDMFKLNMDNEKVRMLIKFDNELIKYSIDTAAKSATQGLQVKN